MEYNVNESDFPCNFWIIMTKEDDGHYLNCDGYLSDKIEDSKLYISEAEAKEVLTNLNYYNYEIIEIEVSLVDKEYTK